MADGNTRGNVHGSNDSNAFDTEHALGWVFALGAIALTVIGLLVGFSVIGGSEQGVNIDQATGAGAETASDWLQGALWLLPAISLAFLSRAFHAADHHKSQEDGRVLDQNDDMFNTEHAGAYIAALATIATAALAPLVGFDVFDRGNVAEDGLLWGVASIVPSVVTNTLHAVRHHQYSPVVRQVETRSDVRSSDTVAARGPR